MKIWIGNIAPGTSDEELKALVHKYAPELTCVGINHEEGTGSRPAAILEFSGGTVDSADKLTRRLSGMYWKERELVCTKAGA